MYRSFVQDFVGVILLLTCPSESHETDRIKRAHSENFNVLLNLYKMNPLKKSNVFKAFYDRLLLPNRIEDATVSTHFNSNESIRAKKVKTKFSFNKIEELTHSFKNKTRDILMKPDDENVETEKFTINAKDDNTFKASSRKDDLYSMFGLESEEGVQIPVTKLLPVNNTILLSVALSNINKVSIKSSKSDEFIDRLIYTKHSTDSYYNGDLNLSNQNSGVNVFSVENSVVVLR